MTNSLRKFWSFCGTSFGLLAAIYLVIPALRKPLVREDNLLEMATALLYLAVTVLAIRHLLRMSATLKLPAFWLVPILSGLGFIEEVSFGRMFFNELPVVLGVKIDAIHDFLRVLVALGGQSEVFHLVLGAGALIVMFGALLILCFWQSLAVALRTQPIIFSMLCLAFVGCASILDLGVISHHFAVFLEEYLEFLAAVALLFAYRCLKEYPAQAAIRQPAATTAAKFV